MSQYPIIHIPQMPAEVDVDEVIVRAPNGKIIHRYSCYRDDFGRITRTVEYTEQRQWKVNGISQTMVFIVLSVMAVAGIIIGTSAALKTTKPHTQARIENHVIDS